MNDKITVFDATTQKSHEWVNDLADEMQIANRPEAYRALRSVLHALRDQLDTPECAHLSAQLPMMLRGMFYEGWVPGGRSHVRSAEEFVALVMDHHGQRPHVRPEEMTAAVGRVLKKHVGEHETNQVLDRLAAPVRALFARETANPRR